MSSRARATFVTYPFAALVAQDEAKLAMLLAAINPRIGGVLLSGPKGIGKTSIVRGVGELLPLQRRAACPYGCDPDGDALCAACAAGSTAGTPYRTRAEIVELPANAQIDDVVGAIDLRAALAEGALAFRPGLLARANRAVLYVDEINLLADAVVDVLLDAAAQGVVRVKRGQHALEYPARFTLIGTMNPEEGELRPQITDRIGLRVFLHASTDAAERAEIYRRNAAFARDPRGFVAGYAGKTRALRSRVARAIALLPQVVPEEDALTFAIDAVTRLGIESHRTEFVALEAACALAALEARTRATSADVRRVFPLAARLRRSRLRVQAEGEHLAEDAAIEAALEAGEGAAPDEGAPPPERGPRLVVSPELAERPPLRAQPQTAREGQPVAGAALQGGRLDVAATLVDRAVGARAGRPAELRESIDSATPMRLTVFVVDASQSTTQSSAAVQVAARELLRPAYVERELAALVSCWGTAAEVVVDEHVGRNIDLVAARLTELEPGDTRTLTPLPDALDKARRIAERFHRSHPAAQIEIAVFSDGRANVPLGGEPELARLVTGEVDVRGLTATASEQCRSLAARIAGRASATFVNIDRLEGSTLMRELADLARGRYFPIADVVAQIE
jgi:Mg-chelatase subunit ChlI/Mg-chelatase subunit ChlD